MRPHVHLNLSEQYPRRGTTFTELLVVIATISTLSGLSFYAFSSAMKFGRKLEATVNTAVAQVNQNAGKPAVTPPTIATPVPTPPAPRLDRIPRQYYVEFKNSVRNPAAEAQRVAAQVYGTVLRVYANTIPGCGIACDDAMIARLSGDPAIQYIDQARYVYPCQNRAPGNIQRVFSNGIPGNQRTGNPADSAVYGIPTTVYRMYRNTAIQAVVSSRVVMPASASQLSTIAILDTGIDKTHPDLFVVAERDFTDDGDPSDLDGHGTHVAGVVAARDNVAAGGVIGVYPGGPLVNLKVMTNSSNVPITRSASAFYNSNPGNTNLSVTISTSSVSSVTTGRTVIINGLTDNAGPGLTAGLSAQLNTNTFIVTSVNNKPPRFTINLPAPLAISPNDASAGGGTFTLVPIPDILTGSNLFVYAALDYVIQNARSIRVCLLPFEMLSLDPGTTNRLKMVADAGVLIVAAAGSSTRNLDTSPRSPAVAPGVDVIAVGAIVDIDGRPNGQGGATDDTTTTYSNFGSVVTFAAPGGSATASIGNSGYQAGNSFIRSTIPMRRWIANGSPLAAPLFGPYSTQVNGPNPSSPSNLVELSDAQGTSFAAAHVAGMLAYATDPQTSMGFIIGQRAVPTYRLQMRNQVGAINGLTNLTYKPAGIQMISPLTGSAWVLSTSPFFPFTKTVTPYIKTFNNDTVRGGNLAGKRIPNFYVNPFDASLPASQQAPSNMVGPTGAIAAFPG